MKKLFILILLAFWALLTSYSQTDSLSVIQSSAADSVEKYDRVYKLFIEDRDAEIKHLWKINLIQFALLEPNIGFEQRIGKNFSSATSLKIGIAWIDFYDKARQESSGLISTVGISLQQEFRYYYNLNRRALLGKRVNGFSGNYFSLHLLVAIRNSTVSNDLRGGAGTALIYGLQRRIGNIGYIEAFGGPAVLNAYSSTSQSSWYITPFLGIRAGFAIDSFSNLKRMLK